MYLIEHLFRIFAHDSVLCEFFMVLLAEICTNFSLQLLQVFGSDKSCSTLFLLLHLQIIDIKRVKKPMFNLWMAWLLSGGIMDPGESLYSCSCSLVWLVRLG